MSYWIAGASIASALIGAYSSQQTAKKQNKLTRESMDQAQRNAADQLKQAEAQTKQADEDINRANMKSPDTNVMMSDAMLTGKQGASGTLLTGAQGISNDKLKLNKTTLLGG